ncbi:MAG: hypothetical protein WAV25_01230 [Minisyncoccia bacterium]
MGSKISDTEWGLLIGFGLVLDLGQWLLDLFIIGVFFNPFIDMGVGLALPLYFKLRGMKTDAKKIASWVGAGVFETLFAGLIPLWTGDIVLTMFLDKADKKLRKMTSSGSGVGEGNQQAGETQKKAA